MRLCSILLFTLAHIFPIGCKDPGIFAITMAVSQTGPSSQDPDSSWEGKLSDFLGPTKLEMQQVFKAERFPNVVVAKDGSVIVCWGSSKVQIRRSEDGGRTWSQPVVVADPGFQGGGLTVDEKSGDILLFSEAHHPPAEIKIYRSQDHGKSWNLQETKIAADKLGHQPSMHMNEHGMTLHRGKHAGRLIRPARWYAGQNERSRWPKHYTNAIYSDDGGKTWLTSAPFPENGTGEATLAELSDGTIYYNSRRHWADEGKNPRRRWTAISKDGGVTWSQLEFCEALPDGPQDSNYGCMAGLVRLPIKGRDLLLYSNCDSAKGRVKGTVWVSFDGGKSWPLKRQVFKGNFAYSSMNAGRPGTKSEGWIYLLFEGGPQGGATIARFTLSWLLKGEPTGDGKIPKWAQ